MKVLYIEPRHPSKEYYHYNSLYDGLKENNCDIKKVERLNNCNPKHLDKFDLILFGYSPCTHLYQLNITNTKTPIIMFLYKFSCFKEEKINFMKRNKHINFYGSQYRINEFNKKYDINIKPTLYPFNPKIFYDQKLEKIFDIGMSGDLHLKQHYHEDAFLGLEKDLRPKIINTIKSQNWNSFVNCMNKYQVGEKQSISLPEYSKKINQSKIWVAVNADHGDLTPRYCEVIASKTLLFCNEQNSDTFKHIFRDKETCVFFKNDLSDFVEKVNYYLENTKEYNKIINTAYEEFHSKYTVKEIVNNYLCLKNF